MDVREERLLRVAVRQGGCFALQQAQACGFSRSSRHRRVADGRWVRLGGGVVRAVQTPPSLLLRQHAALLALGPDSFLSHVSGAAAHRLTAPSRLIWCSVPHTRTPVRLPDVRVIRTRHPEFIELDGLRVATAERTFCDLAMVWPRQQLAATLASGVQSDRLRIAAVAATADQLLGRPGTQDLLAVISEFKPEFESVLGREFHALLARAAIPGVVAGLRIPLDNGRFRVADAAIAALRLDLEADGFAYHGAPEQVQADKERDRELAEVGWRTARFTTTDIRGHPERTIRELPRIVAARARELGLWRP